jgi:ribonuclease P protein component
MSEKPQGFPRSERVRNAGDFTVILRTGSRVRGHFVDAWWAPDPHPAPDGRNRIGVAAGRKLGNAVVRNLLKRRIREAYRRNRKELSWRGVAVIFMASRRMIGADAREVEADVRQLLATLEAASIGGASFPSGC